MRYHEKLVVIGLAIILLVLPLESQAVTVGPAKIEYKVDPSETIYGRIIVLNEGETERTFYAAFEKFTEVDGQRKFLPGEPTELAGWFQMEKSVSLGPKEQKEIPFTIEVPENAPPGGHFAVIWWGTASPEETKQVSIVTRAGILVFLQVSGEVNEKGEVLNFSLPGEKFFGFQLPEDFVVSFKNTGNTYLKPNGEIKIKNIFGSAIATFDINNKERIVLPENTQLLDVSKKFDKPPFAFGLYKAELTLTWGEKPSYIQNIYLFVFPWKAVLFAIIILAALYLLATKGIKKYNQWVIKKYSGRS